MVWSRLRNSGHNLGVFDSISAREGQRIVVTRLGVCGDVHNGGATNRFRFDGGGLSASWGAGRNTQGATYWLGSRGTDDRFYYTDAIRLEAQIGQAVQVNWDYQYDWDGRGCNDTDPHGNSFSDPGSTVRVWIEYHYE
tara:strand:+ start:391 stop:804 length:414 start_codon:yes stop_codon:yes gene_type:complete